MTGSWRVGSRSLPFIALLLALWLGFGCPQGLASVHQYPEGTGQVMLRSLQTLRDSHDRSWQLVLFKRSRNGLAQSIHLRLVGFPEAVELDHDRSLQIFTLTDKTWKAEAVTMGVPISPNVGEYDLQEVMHRLDADIPLRLKVPMQPQDEELVVPPFVVKEWRQVAN